MAQGSWTASKGIESAGAGADADAGLAWYLEALGAGRRNEA